MALACLSRTQLITSPSLILIPEANAFHFFNMLTSYLPKVICICCTHLLRNCLDFLMMSFPNYSITLPDPMALFLSKNLPYAIYLCVYCLTLTPHKPGGLTQTSSFSISIPTSNQKQWPPTNQINQQIPLRLHWPPALQLTALSSITWNLPESLLPGFPDPLLLQPNLFSNGSMNIFKMQIWSLHDSKPVNGFPPHLDLSSQALPWLIFVKPGSPAFPTLSLASLLFVLHALIPLATLFFQYVMCFPTPSPHTWVYAWSLLSLPFAWLTPVHLVLQV